jgi:hypothetical protein
MTLSVADVALLRPYTGVMPKLNLRLPDDLHAALKAAADEDQRSLNGEILWLLRAALAQR